MIFSKTLPGAGVKDIGLRSAKVSGGFDLGMGMTFAFFHCGGKVHSYREALMMLQMGVAISAANSVRIRGGMSPIPGDLEETFFKSMYVSSSVTYFRSQSWGKKVGSLLWSRGGECTANFSELVVDDLSHDAFVFTW